MNFSSDINLWIQECVKRNIPIIDGRPELDFIKKSLVNTTNIPFNELSARSSELPPRGVTLALICENEILLHSSIDYLVSHGYLVEKTFIIIDWDLVEKSYLSTSPGTSVVIWEPSPVLKGVIETIEKLRTESGLPPQGHSVDLACGSGRDCIFLNLRNWTSTGYDYLQSSLDRAAELAQKYHSEVDWICLDLENDSNIQLQTADLVNVSRYLHRPLFEKIAAMVNPGGFVVYHQFMIGCEKPKRKRFLLEEGELASVFIGLGFEIIEDRIFNISDGRPCSWFLARKPIIPHT